MTKKIFWKQMPLKDVFGNGEDTVFEQIIFLIFFYFAFLIESVQKLYF